MKTFVRILGGLVGVVVAALLLVFVYGRFSDGPVGFFSGGPIESGEVVSAAVGDWSFVRDVPTIEFQLLEPARSRTVWILFEDGGAYIPCGMPNFRLWKQWPHEALEDERGVVRIEGKRYPVRLAKIDEPDLRTALMARVSEKYSARPGAGDGPPGEDDVWFFRIESRPAS